MMACEKTVCYGPALNPRIVKEIETLSLDRYIMQLLDERINEVYMIDSRSNEKLTIFDYKYKSLSLAAELQKLGCGTSTVVGIISENCLQYPIIMFATILAGSIITCFNPAYMPGELYHTTNISKPSVVFCSSQNYLKVREILPRASYIKNIILIDQNNFIPPGGYINYASLIKPSSIVKFKSMNNQPSDTVTILYSSGTTGFPKGVMLTHKNIVFETKIIRDEKLMDIPGLTVLLNLPMFHAYGFNISFQTLSTDQTAVVMKKFEEEHFLSIIQQYKIKFLHLVPTLLVFLLKSPIVEKYDLSSLEVILCGAATVKPETEEAVMKKLNLRYVQQGYGLTEFTMVATLKKKESNKKGTIGSVVPGIKVKVVDLETGQNLGPGRAGEIWMTGPSMMKGYYGDKKATDEIIDAEGWLHSGDVGYYDEDGEFFIVDRQKDLIKYKGFQVAPAELEGLLLKHPGINDAAVIGVYDEVAGEIPKAFIVRQSGNSATEKEIVEFINNMVSPQKWLRGGVSFVQEIPKNPSGKILRRKLKELVQLNVKSKY